FDITITISLRRDVQCEVAQFGPWETGSPGKLHSTPPRFGSMSWRRLLALSGMLLLSGCLYHARERADEMVCIIAAQPLDIQPALPAEIRSGATQLPDPTTKTHPSPAMDVQTTAFMQAAPDGGQI